MSLNYLIWLFETGGILDTAEMFRILILDWGESNQQIKLLPALMLLSSQAQRFTLAIFEVTPARAYSEKRFLVCTKDRL